MNPNEGSRQNSIIRQSTLSQKQIRGVSKTKTEMRFFTLHVLKETKLFKFKKNIRFHTCIPFVFHVMFEFVIHVIYALNPKISHPMISFDF